jgi:hypothetical protein
MSRNGLGSDENSGTDDSFTDTHGYFASAAAWRPRVYLFQSGVVAYFQSRGFLVSERETIPAQDLVPQGRSRHLQYPIVTDPAAPPFRPERQIPNSIATLHRRLPLAIAQILPRCPSWCKSIDVTARRDDRPA